MWRPATAWLTTAVVVAMATACSPALNWREVQIEGLAAMLPCKPDHAQRSVPLGAQTIDIDMVGCEASGALYAISHVHTADAAQTDLMQFAWRKAAMANVQAASMQARPFQLAKPRVGGQKMASEASSTPSVKPDSQSSSIPSTDKLEIVFIQGKGPDGNPVQAHMLWLASGRDVYQVAVYGPALKPDMVEPLFTDLALHQ